MKKCIESDALAPDNDDNYRKNGDGLPQNEKQSKSEMLEELMGKPETYDKIGSAWRLFIRLITSNGILIGTYKDIAGQLGDVSSDSVKNWAKHLEKENIIEIEDKGRGKKIMLGGEYMRIATAPQSTEKIVEKHPKGYRALIELQKMVQGASAFGGRIKLSTEDCYLTMADNG